MYTALPPGKSLKTLVNLILCALLGLTTMGVSRCSLKPKQRTFYIAQIVSHIPKGTSTSPKTLIGPKDHYVPQQNNSFFLPAKTQIVVRMGLPAQRGYCRKLTLHIPTHKEGAGRLRIWSAPSKKGPWRPMTRLTKSGSLDLDTIPFSAVRYLKLEEDVEGGEGSWIDAIGILTHTETWLPPAKRPLPAKTPLKTLMTQAQQADSPQKSLELLEHAWRMYPKSRALQLQLGAYFTEQKSEYRALHHYLKAQTQKRLPKIHLQNLSEIYLALGLWRHAQTLLRQCTRRFPFHIPCYKHLIHATSLAKQKKLIIFYRDQYLIANKRANAQYRSWEYTEFIQHFFRQRQPIIEQLPRAFSRAEHKAWSNFLRSLFPLNKRLLNRQEKKRLRRLSSPPRKR